MKTDDRRRGNPHRLSSLVRQAILILGGEQGRMAMLHLYQ